MAQPNYPTLLFHIMGESVDSSVYVIFGGIGDQNGDGYDDILSLRKINDEFYYYFYYGGDPMDTEPDFIFTENQGNYIGSPQYTGNLNGDTLLDFGLNRHWYFGSDSLHEEPDISLPEFYNPDSGLGYRIVGDINNDGFDDLGGQAGGINDFAPYAVLHYGGPDMDTIPEFSWEAETDSTLIQLGGRQYPYMPGYINGDSIPEFLLKTTLDVWGYPDPDTNKVRYAFYGPDIQLEPDTIMPFTMSEDSIIHSIEFMDDFNGDGYPEIYARVLDTVPNWDVNNRTKTIIKGGPHYTPEEVYDILELPYGFHSGNVAYPGDVNGDGYNDLLLGYKWGANPFGMVCLYLGGPEMHSSPNFTWVGSYNGEPRPALYAGASIMWVGDVNNDGLNDIGFTSWNYTGFQQRGHLYIYAGDSTWHNNYVGLDRETISPAHFSLNTPYPNPFNPVVIIPYELYKNASINIRVFNIRGLLVDRIFKGNQYMGRHLINWNASSFSSGIYFIQLESNIYKNTQKVILLK